ncbi:hypothetical protein Gotur_007457, partial [Gossypium turneri]
MFKSFSLWLIALSSLQDFL